MKRPCTTRRRKTEAARARRLKAAQRGGRLLVRLGCEPWSAFEQMSKRERHRLVYG